MRLYAEPQRNLRNTVFRDKKGASLYRVESHNYFAAKKTTGVARVSLGSDGREQLEDIGKIKWSRTFNGDKLHVRELTVEVKNRLSTFGTWKPCVSTFIYEHIGY
jgi:hypothetical protein